MKKEFADLWVAELRSGHHTQARGALHVDRTGAKCCLGVACWIDRENLVVETFNSTVMYSGTNYNLPPDLRRRWGIASAVCGLSHSLTINGRQYYSLAQANDHGVPFNLIADWIEENYKLL